LWPASLLGGQLLGGDQRVSALTVLLQCLSGRQLLLALVLLEGEDGGLLHRHLKLSPHPGRNNGRLLLLGRLLLDQLEDGRLLAAVLLLSAAELLPATLGLASATAAVTASPSAALRLPAAGRRSRPAAAATAAATTLGLQVIGAGADHRPGGHQGREPTFPEMHETLAEVRATHQQT